MFKSLEGTKMSRVIRQAALWVAFIDGISPAVASAIPIIPFLLASRGMIPIQIGIITSILLDMAILFLLGIFLGKVSGKNIWLRGFLMMSAGLITIILMLTIGVI
jgi:predicted membrane protein (TIGR00267 family)